MNEFLPNEVYILLAFAFVVLAFFLWLRSRKRRKKELERRHSLADKIRQKMKRKQQQA